MVNTVSPQRARLTLSRVLLLCVTNPMMTPQALPNESRRSSIRKRVQSLVTLRPRRGSLREETRERPRRVSLRDRWQASRTHSRPPVVEAQNSASEAADVSTAEDSASPSRIQDVSPAPKGKQREMIGEDATPSSSDSYSSSDRNPITSPPTIHPTITETQMVPPEEDLQSEHSHRSRSPNRSLRFSRSSSSTSARRVSNPPINPNLNALDADIQIPPRVQPAGDNESQATGSQPQQVRHFPGTLVIVQGVVHTTEAPRPAEPSSPHLHATSPATQPAIPAVPTDVPMESTPSPPSFDSVANEALPSSGTMADGVQNGMPRPVRDSPLIGDTPSSTERAPGQLSQNSIDVLGTLVSVATAATAASLVTGSTDPLFSSGLTSTFPVANGNGSPHETVHTSPPSSSSTRSASPEEDATVNTDRSRVRGAWESLRDRWARRSFTGAPATQSNRPEAIMDGRERLLAEMARAFNHGMASSRSGQNTGSTEQAIQHQTPHINMPRTRDDAPEGSFEHFLHNLQTDLRATLAEDYNASSEGADDLTPNSSNETSGSSPNASQSRQALDMLDPIDALDNLEEGPASHDSSMVESTVDSSADEELPASQSSPRSHSIEPGPTTQTSTSSFMQRRPGGHINWWRVYRFPPMLAPPTGGVAIDASQPIASDVPQTSVPPNGEGRATSRASPTTGGHPSSTQSGVNLSVVPVIIVGLQSVDAGDPRAGSPPPPAEAVPASPSPFIPTTAVDAGNSVLLDPSEEHVDEVPTTDRRRSWQSRTMDALRGARRGSQNEQNEETAGSRTFMIYVIGGYYPPNHDIVTGLNNFDSFEAFWELAELLRQVKPPVASRQEIEKSDLEVITSVDLKRYELDGRISSNCVERCLICLDEYEGEDPIRILSCRHAFHKNCVDTWLETGRNNCPACRGQGVEIGS